jgi:hypothetical protein
MKTLSFLALLTLVVASARAQSDEPAVRAGELPQVDHMVYLSFLPDVSVLKQDAKANGLEILRVDRTADQIIVNYRYPDGHTATLGYSKLSADSDRDVVRPAAPTQRRVVRQVVTPEPEVVYYEPGYRTRYVYSDPVDNFWVPLTLGIGLGWATSWHGGHGHYYHGHGGWRR